MSDERAAAIARRWSRNGGMGNDRSADDYTDAGCRVLATAAFDDVEYLLGEVKRLRETVERVRDALATDDQAVLKVAAAQQILIDAAALSSSPNKEPQDCWPGFDR